MRIQDFGLKGELFVFHRIPLNSESYRKRETIERRQIVKSEMKIKLISQPRE